MKAILCTAYGPPEVLRPGELEKPTPKSNQVLIRVRAAAVTISDCIVRSGKVRPLLWLPMRLFVGFTRPRNPVLGLDLAGEVEAVGGAVQRFKVGDPVIAFAGKHFGAYAEYVCPPVNGVRGPQDALIAPKPANLGYAEAAAIPSRGGLGLVLRGAGTGAGRAAGADLWRFRCNRHVCRPTGKTPGRARDRGVQHGKSPICESAGRGDGD